jgi:Na+/H+ antiporter NhaD/arsenite permease-like protein
VQAQRFAHYAQANQRKSKIFFFPFLILSCFIFGTCLFDKLIFYTAKRRVLTNARLSLDYVAIAALSVFISTVFLMIKRPMGIKLGYAAAIGALASLLLGTVSLGQAAESFVNIWDAALAFIGIVAFSVILDAMGFFKWAALKVVKLAKGSGLRLFFYVSLLTAAVSILFANDSAVLILTPIVLEIISELKIDGNGKMAYLFAAGLIADTAAMPLITSNPINILAPTSSATPSSTTSSSWCPSQSPP